jgi:hypothetical protein
VKDKLGAEPGGEGKPEASPHQQQATEAVHITSSAQLQASGRTLASILLLVYDSSWCCHRTSPQIGKEVLCQDHPTES